MHNINIPVGNTVSWQNNDKGTSLLRQGETTSCSRLLVILDVICMLHYFSSVGQFPRRQKNRRQRASAQSGNALVSDNVLKKSPYKIAI